MFVYSLWKGYLDKTHTAVDKYKSEFLEYAVKTGCRLKYLHTSGHSSSKDIEMICEITQAKTIIPIHCECPENFANLKMAGNQKIMNDGEVYSF